MSVVHSSRGGQPLYAACVIHKTSDGSGLHRHPRSAAAPPFSSFKRRHAMHRAAAWAAAAALLPGKASAASTGLDSSVLLGHRHLCRRPRVEPGRREAPCCAAVVRLIVWDNALYQVSDFQTVVRLLVTCCGVQACPLVAWRQRYSHSHVLASSG